MTQFCAAGERRRDEMDPGYPLDSATIPVESENKAIEHVLENTGINMRFRETVVKANLPASESTLEIVSRCLYVVDSR
jgi:hypothetical protein